MLGAVTVGITISCIIVFFTLIYLSLKCWMRFKRTRKETENSEYTFYRSVRIPTYQEATKEDPPLYTEVVHNRQVRRQMFDWTNGMI